MGRIPVRAPFGVCRLRLPAGPTAGDADDRKPKLLGRGVRTMGRLANIAALALTAALSSAAFGGAAAAADEPGSALAVIDVSRSGRSLAITGEIVALDDVEVTGNISVRQVGNAGQVASSQARSFVLRAGERGTIANISVSYEVGDTLEITAEVRSGDVIVSRASLTTSPE
jgi:hypothetical protein